MFKIKVNKKFSFEIKTEREKMSVDGREVSLDLSNGQDQHVHILFNNKSYRTEVVSFNREEKTCTVKVNGNIYTLQMQDQYDELLHQLGMDNLNKTRISDLKAPMPGLVLKVLVSEGDEIKKGESLLVLEAMKMENIIKSPADVKIKTIKVKSSDKVEKNQVMIFFE
jgi:biotin carboxyl carrier protein